MGWDIKDLQNNKFIIIFICDIYFYVYCENIFKYMLLLF